MAGVNQSEGRAAGQALVEVNTWVLQLVSLNRRKVTVPVGLKPPDNVAVSRTGAPTRFPGEATVEMVGDALATVKVWGFWGAAR